MEGATEGISVISQEQGNGKEETTYMATDYQKEDGGSSRQEVLCE